MCFSDSTAKHCNVDELQRQHRKAPYITDLQTNVIQSQMTTDKRTGQDSQLA
jgi:hypothetical protein